MGELEIYCKSELLEIVDLTQVNILFESKEQGFKFGTLTVSFTF